jgi:hypothetical protein
MESKKIPKIPDVIKKLAKSTYPDYKGRRIYLKKWDGSSMHEDDFPKQLEIKS